MKNLFIQRFTTARYLLVLFVFVALFSCKKTKSELIEGDGLKMAFLIKPNLAFEAGEVSKILWTPMPYSGSLYFSKSESLEVKVYNSKGRSIDSLQLQTKAELKTGDMVGELKLSLPSDLYFFELIRTKHTDSIFEVETQIMFDNAQEVFIKSNLGKNIISSPVLAFPSGKQINDLGNGIEAFSSSVFVNYGYLVDEGISFLNYLMIQELPLVFFPGQAAPGVPAPPIPVPPIPIPGPKPPPNSEHEDNYCGLSVFVHSMITTFPGALPADVTTNPTSWDKIGDAIDHSNWFGERGAKMVDNVNENFGETHPQSSNGKRYCAGKITDTSLANLAAWDEDCNLKMLIYDWPEFGHWVDVTKINGNQMTVQDYGATGTVTYNPNNESVDFSTAQHTTMAKSNFNGSDKVAGDDPFEIVIFAVVCECDISSGEGKLPSTTGSGKTLKE